MEVRSSVSKNLLLVPWVALDLQQMCFDMDLDRSKMQILQLVPSYPGAWEQLDW